MRTISDLHISILAKNKSLNNFNVKLKILEAWIEAGEIPWRIDKKGKFIRDERGEMILDWFPRNIVEFSKWTSHRPSYALKNCISENFESFGRTTLDKYPAIKRSVKTALLQLNKIAALQVINGDKLTKLNHLELLLKWEIQRKKEAQGEYVRVLLRAESSESKLHEIERLHRADIERLEGELHLLRSENAELLSQLHTIKSIRLV